ncbi:hypothetical protein N7532_001361 [Penicillium argentinense]|uniref:Protein kinase domain-containing protein n=1 Tax=Penicillium argentinense TaxID=1131581 RepID=A0A9W9G2K0_9EURO|nr:uncharacterized protein N7532_001361 [Penicillium argentinense]KAJ5110826.1 hypothetical protein N7532_001361 [Penicillium argentinense]
MDAFNTAASCCEIIWRTLEASAAYNKESHSLATRFKHDARILKHFYDHFAHFRFSGAGLCPEDEQLLDESFSYLGPLLKRAELCKNKLEAQSRWSKEFNRITWVLRRNEVRELEKELYEWTRRLDLRLIALPERARTVMFLEESQDTLGPSIAAKTRIERFTAKAAAAKKAVWGPLFVTPDQVQNMSHPQVSHFSLCQHDGRTTLLESRPHMDNTDIASFEHKKTELGEFVGALNYLDSTISGLLRCIGFYYNPAPSPHFGLIYQLPIDRDGDFISFKSLLNVREKNGRRMKLKYSLNQRLEFARKLATAVFFVHSLGWVHKAIRAQNILLLGRTSHSQKGGGNEYVKWALESPALVGFEIARTSEGDTDPGRRRRMPLELGIYIHPDLQSPSTSIRHSMCHDIYSLGVILLEVGIWSSLETRSELHSDMNPEDISHTLRKMARETELLMGRKYRQIVGWCLNQEQVGDTGGVRLISEVLEKLEDLAESV